MATQTLQDHGAAAEANLAKGIFSTSNLLHYVVRRGSRDWLRHLVVPVIGFLILAYMVINAEVAAQVLGFVWLGIGVIVLVVQYATGRRPRLAGFDETVGSVDD